MQIQTKEEKLAKGNNLYWRFRYRNDSYKARKAAIRHIAILASYNGNRLRLYGQPTESTFLIAKGIFNGWKGIERAKRQLDINLTKNDKENRKWSKEVWKATRCPGRDSATVPVGSAG